MPRGQKTCQCGEVTGPRAKHCPACGKAFRFKPKSNVKIGKIDWKSLKRNDYIKSFQGHGPFYLPENPECEENKIIFMGHYGVFKVLFLDHNGIGAYHIGKGKAPGGFCYLYMGKKMISKTGIIRVPHKIKKIEPK